MKPRAVNLHGIAIGGGILILSIGAFALGNAMSGAIRPLPPIVATPMAENALRLPLPASAPQPTQRADLTSGQAKPSRDTSPAGEGPVAAKPAASSRQPAAEPNSVAEAVSSERRTTARADAARHWNQQPDPATGAVLPASPAPVAPVASHALGFLTELNGLPEAVGVIDAQKGDAAIVLAPLIQAVLANRADPMTWSRLASALDRAGQRAAAITVANRGIDVAKRRQDGDAVTQLMRQIARLELAAAAPAGAPSAASVKSSGSGTSAQSAASAAGKVESDKLAGALDQALRNNAAAEALKILQQMAEGSMARGDFAAAQQAYNTAINLAHLSKLGEARADQYANLGRMFGQKGDKGEAEAYWRAARDQYEQFDLTAKAAEMTALLRQSSASAIASPSRPVQSGRKTTSIIELR